MNCGGACAVAAQRFEEREADIGVIYDGFKKATRSFHRYADLLLKKIGRTLRRAV
jgi:hypothetical protein